MANAKIKTEMKGDTSRWNRRAVQKDAANARRRAVDKAAERVFEVHKDLFEALANDTPPEQDAER